MPRRKSLLTVIRDVVQEQVQETEQQKREAGAGPQLYPRFASGHYGQCPSASQGRPEQHTVAALHGPPGWVQHSQVETPDGGWHKSAWPGQPPAQFGNVPPQACAVGMHSQTVDVGLARRQAKPGGQSPPHTPGEPESMHCLVVVVVLVVGVVVVVPPRIFSTGTQSIFGGPTVTSSSWNWSRKVTAIAGGAGGKRPVSLLQSPEGAGFAVVGVHCFT